MSPITVWLSGFVLFGTGGSAKLAHHIEIKRCHQLLSGLLQLSGSNPLGLVRKSVSDDND